MAKALTLFEARAQVLAAARPLRDHERVPLSAAHGRFLAAPIRSATEWPTTDRSAMDGFALAVGDAGLAAGAALPVVGQSLAGKPFPTTLPAGAAIRIMTGAVVPAGADTVVAVEQTSGFDVEPVTFTAPVRAGQNIRRRGSELAADSEVMAAGRCIDAAAIGALAVLGHAEVAVARRVRVAIVATGDEVVGVEQQPLPHQVRESNSWALAAQVHECGAEATRLGIAPDEAVALRALLQRGLDDADVLLTIGGVSKGTHDLVHDTLGALGVQTAFHGIDLKPGKPTLFGTRATGRGAQYVFGLPGNPASTFTVFDLLVRPLLIRLAGGDPGTWSLAAAVGGVPWSSNARLQAVVARLEAGADGELTASLATASASGDPFSLLAGEVYALVPGRQPPTSAARLGIVGRAGGVRLP